jgi:hypothetical protein
MLAITLIKGFRVDFEIELFVVLKSLFIGLTFERIVAKEENMDNNAKTIHISFVVIADSFLLCRVHDLWCNISHCSTSFELINWSFCINK